MEGRPVPVYKEHLPGREEPCIDLLEQEAPDHDAEDVQELHAEDIGKVMEPLIQQGDLQVGDQVHKGDGEDLGIDQVPPSEEAHLKPSVHLVEEQQQDGIEGHHEPVASPPEGELQHLIIVTVPDEPVDGCLQRNDGRCRKKLYDLFCMFSVLCLHLSKQPVSSSVLLGKAFSDPPVLPEIPEGIDP